MGNQESSSLKNRKPDNINILRLMDTIASKYILTQNFDDLQKLEDKKYCDQLTILTSHIIKDKLTNLEITYLNQRIRDGYQVDEEKKERVIFLKDSELPSLDVQTATKKKRMCMGISRFYVRVAHLFAAIVNTINPEYSYVDANKVKHTVPFMKKMYIPKEMRNKARVTRSGICSNRIKSIMISALKDTQVSSPDTKEGKTEIDNVLASVSISPEMVGGENKKYNIRNTICSMNVNKKISTNGETMNEIKRLVDEPGIPELINLYKDVYNTKTGKYDSMSAKSKADYKEHLVEFYKAFTGNDNMPATIKKFSDIELRSYHSTPNCKPDVGLNKNYNGVEISESLMSNYGSTMANMVKNMNEKQNKLIEILDQVFVYQVDPGSNKKLITLHPNLSNEKLEQIITLARKYIVDIIVGCEKDFLVTLNSFEAIIESLIKKGIDAKIANIKKQEEEKLSQIRN